MLIQMPDLNQEQVKPSMTGSKAKLAPAVGTVRIGTMAAIPKVLKQLGFDPGAVLAEVGFDIQLFDDPDNVIPYGMRSELIQQCVSKTGCQHFGHLACKHIGPSSIGIGGFLTQQSPDVATALETLVRYAHLHVRGAVLYLEQENDSVFLGYSITQPGVQAADQIQDGAVTIFFNIMRKLCGPAWSPLKVCFAHSKLENSRLFRQFFNAPLQFDSERTGLFFASACLQMPLVDADPDLRALLQKQVDQLESRYANDFAEQVRRVLHSALIMRHGSAEHVAALFSIHPRTLNRRLRACGIGFKELADQSRFEIARQLLETSAMTLGQIAETLEYADASSFARAFRNWSGTTPKRWREQHQHTIN